AAVLRKPGSGASAKVTTRGRLWWRWTKGETMTASTMPASAAVRTGPGSEDSFTIAAKRQPMATASKGATAPTNPTACLAYGPMIRNWNATTYQNDQKVNR